MATETEHIDELLAHERGDKITFVAGGVEYQGTVTGIDHDPVDYADGIPISGRIKVDIDVSSETYDTTNLPSEFVTIRATERPGNSWKDVRVSVWDPVVDDGGTIVEDDYRKLGDLGLVDFPAEPDRA